MSTLKVSTIAPLGTDATNTVSLQAGAKTSGFGKIAQLKHTVGFTQQSFTSTSFIDISDSSLSITPASLNSKIFVLININGGFLNTSSNERMSVRVVVTPSGGSQADVAYAGTAPQITVSGGWSVGDIMIHAYDASTGKYWQGKNGTWFTHGGGVGNPATGAYPLVTLNATDRTHDIFPADSSYDGRWSWNFGNGYFKTTAISSAGSNGNGSLFEYDVPSGYYALNTKNINTYG